MKVKCRICGELIEKSSAFNRITNGKNFYCHSEQEYTENENKKIQEKQLKARLYDNINSIIGVTVSTVLYKEVGIWLSVATMEKICSYLDENKQYLVLVMSQKTFSSEYAKIRYFSAIVKNNIADYIPPTPEPIKKVEVEVYDIKYTPHKRRKCLADYEDGD